MMSADTLARDWRAIIKRLDAADTPLKRRNARRAAQRLLRTVERQLDRTYPPLTRTGTARRIPVGPSPCPYCRAHYKTWARLADHVLTAHGACCADAISLPLGSARTVMVATFAGHLRRVRRVEGELGSHFAKAVLRGAMERPQPMNTLTLDMLRAVSEGFVKATLAADQFATQLRKTIDAAKGGNA